MYIDSSGIESSPRFSINFIRNSLVDLTKPVEAETKEGYTRRNVLWNCNNLFFLFFLSFFFFFFFFFLQKKTRAKKSEGWQRKVAQSQICFERKQCFGAILNYFRPTRLQRDFIGNLPSLIENRYPKYFRRFSCFSTTIERRMRNAISKFR